MPHLRLRTFNTRDVYRNVSMDNDRCMVVTAGRHLFLRGHREAVDTVIGRPGTSCR